MKSSFKIRVFIFPIVTSLLMACEDVFEREKKDNTEQISVSQLVAFDPAQQELSDGIIVANDGNFLVSFPFRSEVRRINLSDGTTLDTYTVPYPAGLALSPEGNVIAATPGAFADPSFNPAEQAAEHGVWGLTPRGEAYPIGSLPPQGTLPQNTAVAPNGQLFLSDSFGKIYTLTGADSLVVWYEVDDIQGDPTQTEPAGRPPVPIGANGIAIYDNALYVCVTDFGRIVRIPIRADGTAGVSEVIIENDALFGISDIVFDARGAIYGISSFTDQVWKLSGNTIRVIANQEDGIENPAGMTIGVGPFRQDLFVVNFGFIATDDQPPNPGIIRIQNAVTNR